MPQDAFTLRFLCEELNVVLRGGKVNRIVQPETEMVEFTVYTGVRTEKLVIDVKPSSPRIGITSSECEVPLTAPNFCMLLRKHLIGATINSVSIVGYDRIVEISFTAGGEFSSGEEKTLYVELMGRYSNVILTENGVVLGGNRGINFFDNGVRPLIVGKKYVYPPIVGKKEPCDESLKEYFEAYDTGDLAEYITLGVQGIALLTAKEIVYRYYERFNDYNAENFRLFLREIAYQKEKEPCVLFTDKVIDVFAFPYKHIKGEYKIYKTLIAAEEYYFTTKENLRAFIDAKTRVLSCVNGIIKKLEKKISLLEQEIKNTEKAETYKICGEVILANVYKIRRGDEVLKTENFYDGNIIEIPLDKTRTPVENAQAYFKTYAKRKRALLLAVPRLTSVTEERDYYLSVKAEIELAETVEEIQSVKEELIAVGALKPKGKVSVKKKNALGYYLYLIEGFNVRVGKNNVANDELTSSAKKDDLWLHAKDVHSSHVIIESGLVAVPQSVIIKAAEICAFYSKNRNGGKTEISYALKKNVKKPKGAKPGFFIYDNYSSVTVLPEKHAELLKKER